MSTSRKTIGTAAAVGALAAAGVGVASAIGGSDESVPAADAERAKAAALEAVPGTFLEAERDDGPGAGAYEVEIRRSDGSEVEVHLDSSFNVVDTFADDDERERDDD